MTDMNITRKLLNFYIQIEKSKTVMRHSYTSNATRQESNAEHSWLMAIIAMTVFHELKIKVDELKVLKMVLLHDVGEIITTDIPAFEISERQNNKHVEEKKAIAFLFKSLPEKTKTEFLNLWDEFEVHETREAKIAQALDKMEVLIQHNIADFSTWDQNDFDIHAFYRTDYFNFDSFMRQLRDEVEDMGIKKIVGSNTTHRINPKHQETFKKRYKELLKQVQDDKSS